MSETERHLSVEKAQEGMTLARTLHDANGHVVLREGCELSHADISTLRTRAVRELWVLDTEPNATNPTTQLAAARLQQKDRLKRLFRLTAEQPETGHLRALVARYRGLE